MSREHIYHHGQYLWDMRVLDLIRAGRCRELVDVMPEFVEQALRDLVGALVLGDFLAHHEDSVVAAHFLGQRADMGGGQVAVGILDEMQELDQQVASPRTLSQQTPHLCQSRIVQLPALRRLAPLGRRLFHAERRPSSTRHGPRKNQRPGLI